MIFDAIRRMLGINSRPPEITQPRSPEYSTPVGPPISGEIPSNPFGNAHNLEIFDMDTDVKRIHEFMEDQMRSVVESFGFMFGFPGFPPGEDDGNGERPHQGGIFPFSFGLPGLPGFPENSEGLHPDDGNGERPHRGGIFPFSFGLPGLPGFPGNSEGLHPGMHVPALPGSEGNLEPRDEVLKPRFRRPAAHTERKDEDLDALVGKQGPGVVLDILKPDSSETESMAPFSWSWGGSVKPQISSSSTFTIYTNINGHSTYEKVVRHPDGRVERTVIESDANSDQPGPSPFN